MRAYLLPDRFGLTTGQRYLLLAVELIAVLAARITHRDNRKNGVYLQ